MENRTSPSLHELGVQCRPLMQKRNSRGAEGHDWTSHEVGRRMTGGKVTLPRSEAAGRDRDPAAAAQAQWTHGVQCGESPSGAAERSPAGRLSYSELARSPTQRALVSPSATSQGLLLTLGTAGGGWGAPVGLGRKKGGE